MCLKKKEKIFRTYFCCFRYDFSVRLIPALALFEIRQFKTNSCGLKIDWGSHHRVQLFTECVLRHYILFFYTRFYTHSACKKTDNGVVSG